MSINHAPDMDAREPKDGDLETFEALENGDTVTFFEWPVAPLEVVDRVEDENVGEAVRVESEGEESYLYEVDGHCCCIRSRGVGSTSSVPPLEAFRLADTEFVGLGVVAEFEVVALLHAKTFNHLLRK